MDLVVVRPEGLYCPQGDFYIDPWRPVARAVITHAHGDHARPGHAHYLAARDSAEVLKARLGEITLQTLPYGEVVLQNGVTVSLHPAGHVLGSAQVRLEHGGEIWVVSGDYKLEADATCAPFAPVRCHTFISESTFGLPIYRWRPQHEIFADIAAWWRRNADHERASVLFCYAFGKAQRILAGLRAADALDIGKLICHGAIEPLNRAYRESGVELPPTYKVADVAKAELRRALVLAPPSAAASRWLRRFGDLSDGFASGWMQLRGARRRRSLDRGFVLSDHADWPGLQAAIAATGASRIIITHGQVAVMVRWLTEHGLDARAFVTEFDDDGGDEEAQPPEAAAQAAAVESAE
ncbi:MAG TPA: ligase-associated DNA damage response exonuclease [Casimicrobiaceae bacterium]|jgi:putative mRNA 3-end processing factor